MPGGVPGVSCQVEFAVLGPLEVRVEGRPVQVRGQRQRALLAALLLRPGTVVPVDRLIDEVFGDVPPGQPRNALQTYVARLRSALGPAAGLIVTRPPGYLLDAPREAVDAERFTELAASARDAYSPVAALGLVEQALALWRGAALAEFGGTFARGAALRLDGLRLTAREDHAALLLRAGRAAEAVAGLEALVEEEPWRERAVQLLVTAMAREGRTAGALAAYGRYRDRLRDDLGLDPSPGLRHLEQQVLAGEVQPGPWGPAAAHRPAPPPRRTAFFGRDRELSSLHELLADGRLVSLVGTGGVGKTRLAREVVSGDDPVWWADLAALRDGEAVPNAVASAAGIDLQPGTPLLDMLRSWARSTSGCLILDNCEHLLAPAARLTEELLAESSRVRMLATSREPLGVHGERVFVVRPLDVPAPGDADSAQPAVRLFLDRARAAGAELATDPNTLERTGDICRALDGLPLAIELAAARAASLTIDDLAARLGTRLDLLRRQRGSDPRHRSLRAVMDWSFGLLSPQEQRLFLQLSVFAAAFDLTAAEAVLASDDLPAHRIADLVARLADRSMLTRPASAGAGRYRMLETIRSYAESRLPAPEAETLRRRHAKFFVKLAEAAEAHLHGPDERAWAQRIEAWLDDFRMAWAWARDAGETDTTVRLAAALAWFGYWRLRPDVLAWGTWAVKAAAAHPGLAAVFAAAAHAAWFDGHLHDARELARRGVAAAGGPTATAAAIPLYALGDAALMSGHLKDAADAYDSMASLAAAAGDRSGFALGTANVALALAYADDDQAPEIAGNAVAAALDSGNPTTIAFALFAQGEALADSDAGRAASALDEARQRAEDVGNPFIAGVALTAAVALRGRHGPPEQALPLFRDAVEHWRATGNQALMVTALRNLVVLLARIGSDEAAAALAATLENTAPAKSYGTEAARTETALAAARQRLGETAYARSWTAGQSRTLPQAAKDAARLLESYLDTKHREAPGNSGPAIG
jgi:predicted ATPase/DNA-binding SARP family transcriptional activator